MAKRCPEIKSKGAECASKGWQEIPRNEKAKWQNAPKVTPSPTRTCDVYPKRCFAKWDFLKWNAAVSQTGDVKRSPSAPWELAKTASVSQCSQCLLKRVNACLEWRYRSGMDRGREGILKARETLADSGQPSLIFHHSLQVLQPGWQGSQPYCRQSWRSNCKISLLISLGYTSTCKIYWGEAYKNMLPKSYFVCFKLRVFRLAVIYVYMCVFVYIYIYCIHIFIHLLASSGGSWWKNLLKQRWETQEM